MLHDVCLQPYCCRGRLCETKAVKGEQPPAPGCLQDEINLVHSIFSLLPGGLCGAHHDERPAMMKTNEGLMCAIRRCASNGHMMKRAILARNTTEKPYNNWMPHNNMKRRDCEHTRLGHLFKSLPPTASSARTAVWYILSWLCAGVEKKGRRKSFVFLSSLVSVRTAPNLCVCLVVPVYVVYVHLTTRTLRS